MSVVSDEAMTVFATAFFVIVFPSAGLWLSLRRRRLRLGCIFLPLLILPGFLAINYYHIGYDDPREEAYAQAHPDPDSLVDYDPAGGNVVVLVISWVPPTAVGLLTLAFLGVTRRAQRDKMLQINDWQ